ncbi:MAG: hypothetical protein ACU0CO_03585 [Shimia sp.]
MVAIEVADWVRDAPEGTIATLDDIVLGPDGLLYALSRAGTDGVGRPTGPVLTVHDVGGGGPVHLGTRALGPEVQSLGDMSLAWLGGGADGTLRLLTTGRDAQAEGVVTLEPGGAPGFGPTLAVEGGAPSAVLAVGDALFVAGHGAAGIAQYALSADGTVATAQRGGTALANAGTGITALGHAAAGGRDFLLATSAGDDSLSIWRLGSGGAAPVQTGQMRADQGLGIDAPSVVATVAAPGGDAWILLGAAGSGTISLARLGADGVPVLADHVVDGRDTRFAGVSAIEAITVEGRTFVVAAGTDDGVTLFEVLPHGALVVRSVLADGVGSGLARVSALALQHRDDGIDVFAASGREAGLTHLRIDLTDLGVVRTSGNGGKRDDLMYEAGAGETLRGLGGDDILVAGTGADQIFGNDGADLFVIRGDGFTDKIRDFEPGLDTIDLSGWAGLRGASQLAIVETGWGARVTFADETLEVHARDGGTLAADLVRAAISTTAGRMPSDALGIGAIGVAETGGSGGDAAPLVEVGDQSLRDGALLALSEVVSFTAVDGRPLERIALYDTDGDVHNWIADGGTVNAMRGYETTDLASVYLRGGGTAGPQTLWVRAHDGLRWSDWEEVVLTTRADNAAPEVTLDDQVHPTGTWVRLDAVMGYADADGDPLAGLELWNDGTETLWWADGLYRTARSGYVVEDVSDVWYRVPDAAGHHPLQVRAHDGTEWGAWDAFVVTGEAVNAAPVVAIADQELAPGAWRQLLPVMEIADADGDAPTRVQLWDVSGGGLWWADGGIVQAGEGYATADLSDIWFRGDTAPGDDPLRVRAHDGTEWGAWEDFVLTTLGATNAAPVVTVEDRAAPGGGWHRLDAALDYADADGDALADLGLWDDTGLLWWADGGVVDARGGYDVTSTADIWFRMPQQGAATLWVRAHDGTEWGAWDAFVLSATDPPPPDPPASGRPEIAVEDVALRENLWVQFETVFTFSDPDGDPLTAVELRDATGAPSWWADGGMVDAAAGHVTEDLTGVWLQGADDAGTETLSVRASDGTEWSDWETFTLTTIA